ncbi:MAG: hypothetical protein HQK49_13795 [Oligoflexia bacterium]|nr:hypothetical protein [Oligoflexia bacterium]
MKIINWSICFVIIFLLSLNIHILIASDQSELFPKLKEISLDKRNPIFMFEVDEDAFETLLSTKCNADFGKYLEKIKNLFSKSKLTSLLPLEMACQSFPLKKNKSMDIDVENIKMIIAKLTSNIRSTNCLEAFLYNQQIKNFPNLEIPAEFMAYVFKKSIILPDKKTTKNKYMIILFLSDGTRFKVDTSLVKSNIKGGWSLESHIHNHPFYLNPSDALDVGGVTSPSTNDILISRSMKKEFGLKNVIVTNGFYTFESDCQNLEKFKTK